MCWPGDRSTPSPSSTLRFAAWLPFLREQVHRSHGEVIGPCAEVHRAALAALLPAPYLVTDRHLRRVGRACLVSFDASLYSVPARRVRPGQQVELRVDPDTIAVHTVAADGAGQLLATHPPAARRGAWIVDPTHWDRLPDGRT